MSIAIRPAASGDMRAIGRLGAMLVALHHEFDPARFLEAGPGTAAAYAAFLERQAAAQDAAVIVAAEADAILGYAYGKAEGTDYMALRGPAGMIHDLIVDPVHRGQGIGRRLLDAMIVTLEDNGEARVVLSTAARNVAAQRLFASAGFRQTMIEMTREIALRE